MHEIKSSNTFVLVNSSEAGVIDDHIKTTTALRVPPASNKLPTMYWIPKLHKNPYKSRFISASSKCSLTNISKVLSLALTTMKEFIIQYCEKVFENSGVNHFWSIKNSLDVLDKLRAFENTFHSVDSYDFSTLYTNLPHNLIKNKFEYLVKWCFDKSKSDYICSKLSNGFSKSFFSNETQKGYINWTDAETITALNYLLDNIYIRFGKQIYRQVIGIPMGTNCAPLIADLFLYCYESQFMAKLQKDPNKHHLIETFNNTYRYLDDILSLNNPTFSNFITDIYPSELTLNKSNVTDDRCPFLDLDLRIIDGKLHTKIYDKRDDFTFPIVNFPFLDGDVPLAPSYGVYISQLVRYARICSSVSDFNTKNLFITNKLLKQGYRYHKLVKSFSKFFRKYRYLIEKFNCTRRFLIIKGISHPEFYGNVVYKAYKFKNNPLELKNWLQNLLRKGYLLDILVKSLNLVFLGRNIDNLIVSLKR